MNLVARSALQQDDHQRILALAKQHACTRDFSHFMFSGAAAYEKGWIRVFEDQDTGKLVGFTCVRHKVRQKETSLYFIGIDARWQNVGLGLHMLEDLKRQSPHRRIVLNVRNDNAQAVAFYRKHGFTGSQPALGGQGTKLTLEW